MQNLNHAPAPPVEKYLGLKQLVAELREIGIVHSQEWVSAALEAGVPRIGKTARFSELLDWLRKNPGFQPRSRRRRNPVTVL